MFKNYISISITGKNKDINVDGVLVMSIYGKITFEKIKDNIVEFIKKDKGKDINPDDIAITGISEISKRLFKRLVK